MRGRILVLDHKTPRPDADSGSASTYSYLQILTRAGFDVTFAALNLKEAGRYTQALKDLGITTLSAPEWSIETVTETFAPRSDLLLLFRVAVARRVFDLARRVAPGARILFHAVDLNFLRLQRQAALSNIQAEADTAAVVRQRELDLISRADASIVVSSYELQRVRELLPAANVHHIPILRETPLRSAREAWQCKLRQLGARLGRLGRWLNRRDPNLRGRKDFLFIGGYEHHPNVDAVKWFVREVWPRLQTRNFPYRLIVAGSNMPDEIAALASDRIDMRGYVQDLAQLFAACRLSIAPLRYGAGVKGKIVSSLSYGVPVVATSIAAEGTGLRHGEDILVADTPEALADEIIRLYDDADLWQVLSANGYRAFRDNFSLDAGEQKVLAVVDELVASMRR